MKRLKLNQNGFTLIEAMLIAAILSVLAATMGSYEFQRRLAIKKQMDQKKADQVANAILNAATQSENISATEEAVQDP
jgi:Tfp pilus assembly protein PilE